MTSAYSFPFRFFHCRTLPLVFRSVVQENTVFKNRAVGTILSFYQESIAQCLNQQLPTVVIAPLKVKVFSKFMRLLQAFKLVRQTIDSAANFLIQSTSDNNLKELCQFSPCNPALDHNMHG